MQDLPEGTVSISRTLLAKIWKDYVTPFVLINRNSGIDAKKVGFGKITYTNDIEGLRFMNWKEQLTFPDYVDQWLDANAKKENQ